MNDLEEELYQLKQALSQAEQALATAQKDTKVHRFKTQLQLKDLRHQLEKSENALAQSKANSTSLQSKLAETQQVLDVAKSDLELCREESRQKGEQLQQRNLTLSALRKYAPSDIMMQESFGLMSYEALLSEVNESREALVRLSEEVSQAREQTAKQVHQRQTDRQRVQQELEDYRQNMVDLASNLQQCEEDKHRLDSRCQLLQQQCKIKDSDIQKLESRGEWLEDQLKGCQLQARLTQEERETAFREAEQQSQQMLANLRKEHLNAFEQAEEVNTARLNQLITSLQGAETQLQNSFEQCNRLQQQLRQLQSANISLQKHLENSQTYAKDLLAQKLALQRGIEQLRFQQPGPADGDLAKLLRGKLSAAKQQLFQQKQSKQNIKIQLQNSVLQVTKELQQVKAEQQRRGSQLTRKNKQVAELHSQAKQLVTMLYSQQQKKLTLQRRLSQKQKQAHTLANQHALLKEKANLIIRPCLVSTLSSAACQTHRENTAKQCQTLHSRHQDAQSQAQAHQLPKSVQTQRPHCSFWFMGEHVCSRKTTMACGVSARPRVSEVEVQACERDQRDRGVNAQPETVSAHVQTRGSIEQRLSRDESGVSFKRQGTSVSFLNKSGSSLLSLDGW